MESTNKVIVRHEFSCRWCGVMQSSEQEAESCYDKEYYHFQKNHPA